MQGSVSMIAGIDYLKTTEDVWVLFEGFLGESSFFQKKNKAASKCEAFCLTATAWPKLGHTTGQ